MKSDYFDPYTFDYKAYVLETYNLIEMPVKIPDRDLYKDYITNNYEGVRAEKDGKLVGNIKFGSATFRIFLEQDGNNFRYSLLEQDTPTVAMIHEFERIVSPIKGIVNIFIFNFKWYKSMIYWWFEKEIIPTESVIISDSAQTKAGFKFWKNLFNDYVNDKKTHKLYVVDFKTGNIIKDVKSTDEMDEYFDMNMSKYRFVLERLE